MRIWKIVCLALGGLCRTRVRAVLTCVGVAIAAGALVSMVAFALGLQARIEAPLEQLGLICNIDVSAKEDGDSEPDSESDAESDSESDNPPALNDEALEQFESIPGVAVVYPDFQVNDIEVRHGEHTETTTAVGLPRDVGLLGLAREFLVAGDLFSVSEVPEAIVGEALANDLGFDPASEAVGAELVLEAGGLTADEAATFEFQRRRFEVTVVGVYSLPAIGMRSIRRGIVLPVELMKDIPGVRAEAMLQQLRAGQDRAEAGYRRAVVRVEQPGDVARVEKAIVEMGFQTHTMLSELEEMRTFFVFLDLLLASVGTVALVVAALGIVNTLLMSILERRQEIGIYKAIGASHGDLLVMFLTEASILGFFGGLGGLVLGRIVSWGLNFTANVYARSQGVSAEMTLFAFPWWLLAAVILFSMVISVLAGVYPALRAARLDPIQALRSE